MQETVLSSSRHRRTYNKGMIVLTVICLVASSASVLFYTKYRGTQNTSQAQQKRLVAELAKVINLPSSSPTVVTVSDKSKLTNQALAARVRNNDMLLIYGSAHRIIVYRPSIKRVTDMLSFDTQSATPSVTESPKS